jgi:metal-responsive CopG/Arc/MetJ family transcriptional regulator
MNVKRTHIVIPQQLVVEIDTLVGKRGRSAFLAQAAEKELMRLRQIKALESAAGSWKDADHPELKAGAAKWVKKLRQEYEQRFEKVTRR